MIDQSKSLSIEMTLSWSDELVEYKDRYFLVKTNFWRDFYPPLLDYQIRRAELHQTIDINYKPDELLGESFDKNKLKTIPISKFNFNSKESFPTKPAVGRFYLRGLIDSVEGCFNLKTAVGT